MGSSSTKENPKTNIVYDDVPEIENYPVSPPPVSPPVSPPPVSPPPPPVSPPVETKSYSRSYINISKYKSGDTKSCSKCNREIMLKQGTMHPYWWHTDGKGSCSKTNIRQTNSSVSGVNTICENIEINKPVSSDTLNTICHTCNKEVELKWSRNGKPFWKHLADEGCFPSTSESITHRFAKEQLAKVITNGADVKFKTTCERCGFNYEEDIPKEVSQVVTEYKYNNPNKEKAIFDIACLDKHGNIVIGIEIFYKHETDNKIARMGTKWYEVSAIDVLKFIKLPSFVLNNNIKMSKCDGLSCLSLVQTAINLGYLDEPIPESEILILVNLASGKGWNTYPNFNPSTKVDIWESFIKRNCCLKCGRTENTKIKKPYCVDCYKEINLNRNRIKELNDKLKWLNNAPPYSDQDKSCFYCNRTYMDVEDNIHREKFWGPDRRVSTKLRYNNTDIRCCMVCLSEKLVRLGLIK